MSETKVVAFEIDEIVTGQVSATSRRGFEGFEDREKRIKALLTEDGPFIKVGQLLSKPYGEYKRAADAIAKGLSIHMIKASIKLNGKEYPLKSGQVIGLDSDTWLCPGCGSQHGTGIQPSPKVNADQLAAIVFWYAPKSQTLVTFSNTCWGRYVKAQGLAKRFVVPNGK